MVMEVYSGTQKAVPHRSAKVALLLLIGASVLAGSMVQRRSGVHLGPVMQLDGWAVSFSAPVGFTLRSTAFYERWQMASFVGPVGPGEAMHLMIWERPIEPGIQSEVLAEAVLRMSAALLGRPLGGTRARPRDSEPLIGEITATETWSPTLDIAARAAVIGDVGYAVSVSGQGETVSASAYERFDLSCRSIAPVQAAEQER